MSQAAAEKPETNPEGWSEVQTLSKELGMQEKRRLRIATSGLAPSQSDSLSLVPAMVNFQRRV